MSIKVKAPAKINLTLDILNKRTDGYHLVKMIMQSVDLYDYVTVDENNHGEIKIFSDSISIPLNSENIVYKAAKAFFEFTGDKNNGINISIEKNIPVAAGLAGGSSDAAAVITALNILNTSELSIEDMCRIAENVGADVPFCMLGGTMLAQGIGTVLTVLPDMPDCCLVLAKPKESVSTKEAYALSDKLKRNEYDNSLRVVKALEKGNLKELSSSLFNRFEEVMSLSQVDKIKHIMTDNGALGACMSGSGATVFAVFEDKSKAEICYDKLKLEYEEVFICHPQNKGTLLLIIE